MVLSFNLIFNLNMYQQAHNGIIPGGSKSLFDQVLLSFTASAVNQDQHARSVKESNDANSMAARTHSVRLKSQGKFQGSPSTWDPQPPILLPYHSQSRIPGSMGMVWVRLMGRGWGSLEKSLNTGGVWSHRWLYVPIQDGPRADRYKWSYGDPENDHYKWLSGVISWES